MLTRRTVLFRSALAPLIPSRSEAAAPASCAVTDVTVPLVPLVPLMQQAGVELLTGTDMGSSLQAPGFSLHDEMAYLVDAGLRPMEAIQAATRNPARWMTRIACGRSKRESLPTWYCSMPTRSIASGICGPFGR